MVIADEAIQVPPLPTPLVPALDADAGRVSWLWIALLEPSASEEAMTLTPEQLALCLRALEYVASGGHDDLVLCEDCEADNQRQGPSDDDFPSEVVEHLIADLRLAIEETRHAHAR